MKKLLLFLTAIITATSGMRSQSVAQFADVDPGLEGSNPQNKILFNGLMYFTAFSPGIGVELWKSDGTVVNTVLADDMEPGSGSLGPNYLTVYNGNIYFTGYNNAFGSEVFRSNGLSGGTSNFADVEPGTTGSNPDNFTVYNNELFFIANTAASGREIWKTNGTTTTLLKDINPGPTGCATYKLNVVNGKLIFSANDGTSGNEIWVSDGTTGGTQLLKDIFPGSSDGTYMGTPAIFGTQIYFSADDGVNGQELWISDGTLLGTTMVKDINPGSAASSPYSFYAANNRVYFTATTAAAGGEPWTSDGTALNTNLLAEVVIGATGGNPQNYVYNSFDGKLYFTANTAVAGMEPWITNGTQAGTMILKNIVAGSGNSMAQNFFVFDNKVFFTATPINSPTESELFYSNGTTAGTNYWDIYPGTTGSQPQNFFLYNGKYFFTAADSNGGMAQNDYELWALSPNTPPTITPISNPGYCLNASISPITFIVKDDAAITTVTVTASSSNTALVTNGGLNITGVDTSKTLNITPVGGQSGSTTITITATDATGAATSTTFTLTIYAPPAVSGGANQTVCLNTTVTLSASGATTYTWTGGITNGVAFTPTVTANYTVTGTDVNTCTNTAMVNVTVVTVPTPNICMVSTDSMSINNLIFWDKTVFTNMDSFIVYREVSTNTYVRIGSVSKDSLSMFIDANRLIGPANGDPNIGFYRYKLQLRDTCGNYSALSPYHSSVYFVDNHTGTFTWNTYLVEGQATPVSNFILRRDNANNNIYVVVGTVSGNTTTLNDPQYGTYQAIANWRIDATGFNCTPTMRYGNNGAQTAIIKAKSNITNNRSSGMKNAVNYFSVYPNPTNGNLTINFANGNSGKVSVKILSAIGQDVYNETFIQTNENHNIDLSKQEAGIYLVQITTNNTTTIKRIVKN